jgi:hypothetical protein
VNPAFPRVDIIENSRPCFEIMAVDESILIVVLRGHEIVVHLHAETFIAYETISRYMNFGAIMAG